MLEPSTNSDVAEFRIEEQSPRPAVRILVVHGDADLHAAPELRERLRGAIDDGATTLVVDLSETSFLDSTSLGVLLGAMKRLREQDGQIRLVVPRPEVRRIFEITLLDRIFPLHETQEEALAEPSDQARLARVVDRGVHGDHRVDRGDLEHAQHAGIGGDDGNAGSFLHGLGDDAHAGRVEERAGTRGR